MNASHYRISLDIHSADSQVQLVCRRGETGRLVQIRLTERGQPYLIGSGCIAELAARLPDGTVLKNACGISGDVISYRLTTGTTALAGVLECEIRLLDYDNRLLVSPKFSLAVYDTVYNSGDAVQQEGPSASTVKSSQPGFAQVFLWSDGNPRGENRLGCFVSADVNRSSAMIVKADGESQILGVTAAIPGFAAAAGQDKFDGSASLTDAYEYVTMLGFVPVIDHGRCTVNGRCCSGPDGTAVPCAEGGYYVVERIDPEHVTVLITADGDLSIHLGHTLEKKQWKLGWVSTEDIDRMLAGTYQGFEDEQPEIVEGRLFAVQEEGKNENSQ